MTPSQTQKALLGFEPPFSQNPAKPSLNPQNPPKPAQNPQEKNIVLDSTSSPRNGDLLGLRGFETTPPKMQKTSDVQTPDVGKLRERWEAGHFDGVAMTLTNGAKTADLSFTLKSYFGKKRLSAGEQHDLEEIARAVPPELATMEDF